MGSATTSELRLGLRPPSPTSTARFLGDTPASGAAGDGGFPKLEEYVRGLEVERRKIEGFRRELPLSMLILTHVIEGLKGELAHGGGGNALAVKNKLEDEGEVKKQRKDRLEKVNWMSPAQLWSHNYGTNASTYNAAIRDDGGKDAGEVVGADAQPRFRAPQPPPEQAPRKERLCWSPELHRRFLDAIGRLGGSQAATPKQIRELMKVDGLTCDEVKSHLQKYRLHTRRLPVSSSPANQAAAVLGGLRVSEEHNPVANHNTSQPGSPQDPLQLGSATEGIMSITGGDSCEEDDRSSENY